MDPAEGFTEGQRTGLAERLADQDRTLDAMHQLESALAQAAPRRESEWRATVASALTALDEATSEEHRNAERPESLLSDIKRTQPRLRTRVRGLRTNYQHLRNAIESLSEELDSDPGGPTDYADIRHRLSWVLTALHHQRARESDLIYDAYYDEFNTELGDPPAASRRHDQAP